MIIERIEIPNFILEIPLTKGRRAKKDETGRITNKAWINKPRVKRINGQDIWVGINEHLRSKMAKELKLYLYDKIKDIEPITTFPIGIDLEFHFVIPENDSKLPDIDNISLWWRKCLHDALAGNVDYIPYSSQTLKDDGTIVVKKHYEPNHSEYPPKIPDDNIKYVREANNKFIPITDKEERKIVIIIRTLE